VESDLETISLIEQLSEAGFKASVVATYNCYFPFYEEVVLRRLIAAGCTHNVLLVDATRCAEAFASEDLRPRRAGRDYTLIPVAVGGAFHPKMFLRVGKSKGSLFVGSHNMTFAGFGLNDELTNAFRTEGASARSGAGPFRRAFEYLAAHVPSALPDLLEAYEGVKQGVPWLEGPMAVGERERTLLTASTTGSDLWSQILPLVPRDLANAFICAPFFDPKLAFVRRLLADARPRALTIGIDPATVDIDPTVARALDGVRFVNIAGVPKVDRPDDAEPYLHAKMLWFAGADAELLITGSANASVAAFLAPSATRNAEAVVADRRAGAADAIGIEALWAAPVITSAEWNAVTERRAIKLARSEQPGRRILVATPTPQGFLAQEPIRSGTVLRGMGDDEALLGDAVVSGAMGGRSIEAPELVRDEARFLETIGADEPLLVIVHRTEDIAKNLGGDTRKALRLALGALEEDPSQLETLLKLTEKVIFDSDDVVRTTPFRAGASTATPGDAEPAAASLALDAQGRRRSRQRRSLASGDIAVLLDALMRRLGEGLTTAAAPQPSNDREEVGADEEDGGELAREPPDHEELAKACRSKMRRLIRRMEGQIELAAEPDRARRGVVQLAAVLAVVHTLRLVERRPEWRRQQLRLVEPDDQWRIFQTAVLALTWGSEALAPRALLEANGEMFEELSMVVGLLGWLAWEMEIDIGFASERAGQRGVEEESWYGAQLFASLAPWLTPDARATAILNESVSRTPRYKIDGNRWLVVHVSFAAGFDRITTDPGGVAKAGRAPRPGDLVVLSERFDPRVRVVLEVAASGGDTKVTFYDHDEESGQRTFLASRVATLPWEPLRNAIAATA
jgi:hypothetical protein